MNYELLNQKIKDAGIKKAVLKSAMNCNYTTLQYKLDGRSQWTLNEIVAVDKLLRLTKKERDIIFFGR